jgi:hypothetical protein
LFAQTWFSTISRNTRGQCIVGEVLLLSEESIEKIFLNEQRRVIVDDKTQMKVSDDCVGEREEERSTEKKGRKLETKKKGGVETVKQLTFLCFSTNFTNSCQQQQIL